jgi:hypothetical protein
MREMDEHSPAEWDECQIAFRTRVSWGGGEHAGMDLGMLWFVAEAQGPHGSYEAAKSPETPIGREAELTPQQTNPVHASLLQQLVDDLVAAGWHPLRAHGATWWQRRFRREARAKPRTLAGRIRSLFRKQAEGV